MIARHINAMCGCTTFNAWNVQFVPQADLDELAMTLSWQKAME